MAPGGIAQLDVPLTRLRAIYIAADRFRQTYEAEQEMKMLAWRVATVGCFPRKTPPPPGRCGPLPGRSLGRVGGTFCVISIAPEHKGEELPCDDDNDAYLSPKLKPMKDDLVKSLKDLVQQRTWNCLNRNRHRYELDWERIFKKQGAAAANLAILRHDPDHEVCR